MTGVDALVARGTQLAAAFDGAACPERPATDTPLDRLGDLFQLSAFERDLLALCAAAELSPDVARAVDGRLAFTGCLGALPGAHWSAAAPDGPLRAWRLVVLDLPNAGLRSPIRVDERVLHYLIGLHTVEAALLPALLPPAPHVAGSDATVESLVVALTAPAGPPPVVEVVGSDRPGLLGAVTAAATALGHSVLAVDARAAPPTDAPAFEWRVRLLRESVLANALIVVDAFDVDPGEGTWWRLVDDGRLTVVVLRREPLDRAPAARPLRTVFAAPATVAGTIRAWREALGDHPADDDLLLRLAHQFEVAPSRMPAFAEGAPDGPTLWRSVRRAVRPRIDHLARRIRSRATFDDLVVPPDTAQRLRHLVDHATWRARVQHDWSVGARSDRGHGATALFSGPSGTGKTFAAEVVARALDLDLYRIDLSAVVSKYIGETEQNLRAVFDAADTAGCVLLFDEADSLFGRRSEVRDAHDRHANVEVSYLLQRLELYRGVAILTSNLPDHLDRAFLRRLRHVVGFPFPGVAERRAIWVRLLSGPAVGAGVDVDRLAEVPLTGAGIRNVVVDAAVRAAASGTLVLQHHLVASARDELEKIGASPVTLEGTP